MTLKAGITDRKREGALAYCRAWLHADRDGLLALLSPDIVVVECYGPEYRGLEEVEAWFDDWHAKGGRVLAWDVDEAGSFQEGVCLKWRFVCRWDGRESGFDGVSLMKFDEAGRISRVEEFSAKAEHIRPYRKEGKGDV